MKANDRISSVLRCVSPGHYWVAIEWRGKTRSATITDMPLIDEYKSSDRGGRREAIAARKLVEQVKQYACLR